ncbi:MAG: hypothetical protein ACXIVD_07820 [Salinarimonas sp.]
MAISETVISEFDLRSISIRLGDKEEKWRTIYASRALQVFLADIQVNDPPTRWEADLTPKEQLYELFRVFITGEVLRTDDQFHVMRPTDDAVWELKTPDLRIFGWFIAKDQFAGIFGDWAERIKEHGLYAGYRDEITRRRLKCGADDTCCVWETEENAVVSIRNR